MLNPRWVIARKEIVESLRDSRSIFGALMYTMMGPAVVFLVSLGDFMKASGNAGEILPGMLSVFALAAAFSGGMNVAMDLVAGERERRSLLPLLMNAVNRSEVLAGKWLAVCAFAAGGLALNLLGSAAVLFATGMQIKDDPVILLLTAGMGLLPLPFFAASLQLLLSTGCRSLKEAQTYLSMAVFLPVGLGMFGVFFPSAAQAWGWYIPLLGQQLLLQAIMKNSRAGLLPAGLMGCSTLVLAALCLYMTASRLRRDAIVYAS
jgi:sodium transport system permease protein